MYKSLFYKHIKDMNINELKAISEQLDEALNSNNDKRKDHIDWGAAGDAALVVNSFQTFMREVITLYIEALERQENGVH